MLNEEKVTMNPFIDGEDPVEINMWYLDNKAGNHILEIEQSLRSLMRSSLKT